MNSLSVSQKFTEPGVSLRTVFTFPNCADVIYMTCYFHTRQNCAELPPNTHAVSATEYMQSSIWIM